MLRRFVLLLVALKAAPLAAAAQARAPRDLVARAVAALGGETALRDVRTLTVDFYTVAFALGQEETPGAHARANLVYGQTQTDYAGGRHASAVELRNVLGAVNRMRRVTEEQIGMLEMNGRPAPDAPGTVANIQRGLRRAVDRVLIAALDNPAAVQPLPSRTVRGEAQDGVRYALGPDTLHIYFARRSGLPVAVETLTDDPILGDRRTVTVLGRWQQAGAMQYPRQTDVEVNGRRLSLTIVTAVAVNAPLADSLFAIPDSIRARAQPANPNPPAITVTLAELAPGVWRAEGGSHHSLIVDQGAELVILEAPQSTARMQAVLDTLRSRFAGRRVGRVVNTHHHWDHAGGLRAALAAGVPVITHARNTAFVESIGSAEKTVQPDALSRRGARRPAVTGVEDSLTIGTGERRVVVYRFPSAHVEGMLAAYVPSARLLFQSDVLSPGQTLAPAGSREIAAFVRARGLAVERVAGGHGGVANWADVERASSQD